LIPVEAKDDVCCSWKLIVFCLILDSCLSLTAIFCFIFLSLGAIWEIWNAWLCGLIRKKAFIHTFEAGLGKSTCQMEKKLRKSGGHISTISFLLLIFFSLHLLTLRDTPRSFAFVALDRMVGLGLGAFLQGRA
jgi:hypothetical protein